MQVAEAVELLSGLELNTRNTSTWADLGCGDGFFTGVLATMLPANSMIYAVDKQFQTLEKVAGNNTRIIFQKADFVTSDLQLPPIDGILMANSLHYVADKNSFVNRLKKILKPDGMLLVIEYDTTRANQWVPFPVDFKTLSKLFANKGYTKIQKIGEKKSIYNRANIYACSIKS